MIGFAVRHALVSPWCCRTGSVTMNAGPFPGALLGGDGPAVPLDDLTADREPDARPLVLGAAVQALEER